MKAMPLIRCPSFRVPAAAVRGTHRAFHAGPGSRRSPENKYAALMDQLVAEPQTVRASLRKLRDIHGSQSFKEKVTDNVKEQFADDYYNLSLFECATSARSLTTTVNRYLKSLFNDRSLSSSEIYQHTVKYFQMLSNIMPKDNFETTIKIHSNVLERLLPTVPISKYKEFFMLLMEINCEMTENVVISKFLFHLRCGSPDEIYTFLNAKLPSLTPKNNPDLVMKHNYSYTMFSNMLRVYNRARNSEQFSRVISLLFQKIEDDRTAVPKEILLSRAYEHLMAHVVTKYNIKPSLLLLQDMQNNAIPISNRMLMILLNRLTMDSDLQNFAVLTNYILELHKKNGQKLTPKTVEVITSQTLKIMQISQFSYTDLKVIAGYFLAFFGKSEPLLERLGLLAIADEHRNFAKADVSEALTSLDYPPMSSLEQFYKACFRYMNFNKTATSSEIKEMYIKFRDTALHIQDLEKSQMELVARHPLSSQRLNDKVLKLFMRQMAFRFSSFEGAAELLADFMQHFKLKVLPNPYVYDMIIRYYLRHNDVIHAFEWFDRMVNQHDVNPNMRTLARLISASYELGSDNSRTICAKLMKDFLAPAVNANVYSKHLNAKLRSIAIDLNLEKYFDLDNLPTEVSNYGPKPGRTVANDMNFESEFNEYLLDSFTASFAQEVDEVFEDGEVQSSPALEKYEIGAYEEEDIFEVGDIESAESPEPAAVERAAKKIEMSKTAGTEDGTNLKAPPRLHHATSPPNGLDVSGLEHTPIIEPQESVDTDEMVREIASYSLPSQARAVRQDPALYKRRKQFIEMLDLANNNDIVMLLLKFLQKNEHEIIFYKSKRDYRSFNYVLPRKMKNRKRPTA